MCKRLCEGFEYCSKSSKQGTQNYLPLPPESNIELWVPKSAVDTQLLKTQEKHTYHSPCGIGQNLGAAVVVDSSVLPDQSRWRTRLRIAASIALLFCACLKGVSDTIAPLSRWLSLLSGLG